MIHVRQPEKSRVCGQAVTAMLLGVSLDESCALFGHRHGTRTKELLAVLKARALAPRLKVHKGEPPAELAILKVKWPKGSHWVLFDNGLVHDPEWPGPTTFAYWIEWIETEEQGKVTSHLPIRR